MTPQRWAEVRRLFHACLGLGVEAREGLLRRECGGDPAMWAEVQSLLVQADRCGGFLERPAAADELDME